MESMRSSFTILFEGPFWIGVYEVQEGSHYEVCKITFGPEPKECEVYELILYIELALPILIISYVGIIHRLGHEQMKDYLILGIIALVPILLIVKKSFTSAMLLGICLLIVITVYVANSSFKGKRVKLLGGIYGGVGILGVLMVLLFSMQPHRLERLRVFLNPQLAPVGGGYEIIQMKIIRENASFLGGRGLEIHPIGYLPEPTSNRIFIFIIGSMGWLMDIFLSIYRINITLGQDYTN